MIKNEVIYADMHSGRELILYPGSWQNSFSHSWSSNKGNVGAVLVSWEERHDIRLRTGWGQTPSASYRNLGFTVIKLGNPWRAFIRHESSFILRRSLPTIWGRIREGTRQVVGRSLRKLVQGSRWGMMVAWSRVTATEIGDTDGYETQSWSWIGCRVSNCKGDRSCHLPSGQVGGRRISGEVDQRLSFGLVHQQYLRAILMEMSDNQISNSEVSSGSGCEFESSRHTYRVYKDMAIVRIT